MSPAAPRILIVNTHSVLNSGDAAIVLAQVRWLEKTVPGAKIALTSRTARADRVLYGPMGLRVIPALYEVPSLFVGGPAKLKGSLTSIVRVRAKTDLVREIARADLVVGSGGGYFYSNRPSVPGPMFIQNIFHLKLACLLKKPVVLFPQSFGPTFDPGSARLLRNLLSDRAVRSVLIREENSFGYLEKLLGRKFDPARFTLCPDMAFLLSPEAAAEPQAGPARPVTAITVRNWDFPELESAPAKEKRRREYFEALEETAVRIYQKRGGTILLFPQSRGPGAFENDRPPSLRLFQALKARIPPGHLAWIDFPDVVSPYSIQALCGRADLVIATRFHSAILALIGGTPVISLNYQPKSSGMMKMLGLEKYAVDIADARADVLVPLAEDIFGQGSRFRESIRERMGRTRERAEEILRGALNQVGMIRP